MNDSKMEDEYMLEGDFEGSKEPGFKAWLQKFLESKYFFALILILISSIAFLLGRISVLQEKKVPVRVVSDSSQNSNNPSSSASQPDKQGNGVGQTATVQDAVSPANSSEKVVASKSGTKYHYPWCAGAKQISEKNLITFNSIEEARAKGYTPAANCKGLK